MNRSINRSSVAPRFLFLWLLGVCSPSPTPASELEWIEVSKDGRCFELVPSGRKFTAWGFNYDHQAGTGRLLEQYWKDEWPTIEQDFREMKELGANVVRIHLQFGAFMRAPDEPNEDSLKQLDKLVRLAEQTGLYLDMTGLGCYHKPDVPPWYDKLTESARWKAQAAFWEAIARRYAESPAIFCYDLMNEPVVPGNKERESWLAGRPLGNKYFVQYIALSARGRPRHEIAKAWIDQLTGAIRKHDRRHLVTVGLVWWSLDRPGLKSGFVPEQVSQNLDFLAVHIYPRRGKIDEAIDILKGFAAAGKPVVIEETFVLRCDADELEEFFDRSRTWARGWIGFYWGKRPDEYRPPKTIPEAMTLQWLELFVKKRSMRQP